MALPTDCSPREDRVDLFGLDAERRTRRGSQHDPRAARSQDADHRFDVGRVLVDERTVVQWLAVSAAHAGGEVVPGELDHGHVGCLLWRPLECIDEVAHRDTRKRRRVEAHARTQLVGYDLGRLEAEGVGEERHGRPIVVVAGGCHGRVKGGRRRHILVFGCGRGPPARPTDGDHDEHGDADGAHDSKHSRHQGDDSRTMTFTSFFRTGRGRP